MVVKGITKIELLKHETNLITGRSVIFASSYLGINNSFTKMDLEMIMGRIRRDDKHRGVVKKNNKNI